MAPTNGTKTESLLDAKNYFYNFMLFHCLKGQMSSLFLNTFCIRISKSYESVNIMTIILLNFY